MRGRGIRVLQIVAGGALVLGIVGLGACGSASDISAIESVVVQAATQHAERGALWMFPGLVGWPDELEPAYKAYRDAGLQKSVRFFGWNEPRPDFMTHLTDLDSNRAQARAVAAQITSYARTFPEAPIDLVGYSAGAAMAIFVCEALPDDVRVRNIVLAQADLSPSYELTTALRHMTGKIVHFYCPTDVFLSGGFNLLFGTLDRRYAIAVGKDGFVPEIAIPDESQRHRLIQLGWSEEWAEFGHPGNHVAILQYRWNRFIVSPYVVEPENLAADLRFRLNWEFWGEE